MPGIQVVHDIGSNSMKTHIPTQWSAQQQRRLLVSTQQCQLQTAKPWTNSFSTSAPMHHTQQQYKRLRQKCLQCLPPQYEAASSSSVSTISHAAGSQDDADISFSRQQRPASEDALAAAEAIAAAAEAAAAVVDAEAVTATAAAWQAEVFSKAVLGNRDVGLVADTSQGWRHQPRRGGQMQLAKGASASSRVDQQQQASGTAITPPHRQEGADDNTTAQDAGFTSSTDPQQQQQQAALPDLLGLKQAAAARAEAAAVSGAAANEMEVAWQEAVKAVSAAVGIPVAIVFHQTELLRLLLPDLDQTLAAKRAASLQWEAVCSALQLMQPAGGSVDWAKDEAIIMDMVMAAVRSSERDGNDAFLHNSLMMAISNFFMAVRCYGRGDPDLRRQHSMLLSQLRQCVATQSERAAQLLNQQVQLAATTEQLPEKLIGLKGCLPTANVSQIVVRHPPLLRHQPEHLKQMVAQAESLLLSFLDSADVVFLLESEPWLLEEGAVVGCIEGLRDLFSAKEPCTLLLQHARTGGSKLLAEFRQQAFELVGLEAQQRGSQ